MHSHRKGIILAGGQGTRLYPATSLLSKQLLLVYDKPMIYYPISTLMLCGIRDILIITTPSFKYLFEKLLNDGKSWGINFSYQIQEKSEGISHAISLAEGFTRDHDVAIALGDNIFHGSNFVSFLESADSRTKGGTIFAYPVSDPHRYGVVEFDKKGKILNINEKPRNPKSQYAITGLYFFDNSVFERIKRLDYSPRKELEITGLNNSYLLDKSLNLEIMGRGMAWFDTGTFESLHEGSSYIRSIENRQGLKVGCPEEVAWRQGWINDDQLGKLADQLISSGYGEYLLKLIENKK
tara:strand:- start:356 stop:1240 length:885 start_codon:yes stop_codon:yes gene_type:complete